MDVRAAFLALLLLAAPLAGCLDGSSPPSATPTVETGAQGAPPGSSQPTPSPTADPTPAAAPTPASPTPEPTAEPPTARPKGPAWSFADTKGVEHTRDAPAGNATLLFFMASWCSSCRTKAPMLAKLHDEFADRGVRFYSVSFDPSDNDGSLDAWSARYQNEWPHGVDPGFSIQRTFGIRSQSSFVVLDRDGQLVEKWNYGGSEASLRDAIGRALA